MIYLWWDKWNICWLIGYHIRSSTAKVLGDYGRTQRETHHGSIPWCKFIDGWLEYTCCSYVGCLFDSFGSWNWDELLVQSRCSLLFFRRIRSYRFPLWYPMIIELCIFGPCIRGARWTNVEKQQQCSLFTKSLTVLISQVWQVVQIHDVNPQQTWMIMNICCAFYPQTGETLCKMIVNQWTQKTKT